MVLIMQGLRDDLIVHIVTFLIVRGKVRMAFVPIRADEREVNVFTIVLADQAPRSSKVSVRLTLPLLFRAWVLELVHEVYSSLTARDVGSIIVSNSSPVARMS